MEKSILGYMNICPLCGNLENKEELIGLDTRKFIYCKNCWLVFVDRNHLPSTKEEKQRYLAHKNTIENSGYVEFLNKAITPALKFIKPGMKGLDYGCGPSPVLCELLKAKGFFCDNYDPLFFPNLKPEQRYDFIFATESFEHFFNPANELIKIKNILNKDGYLIVMTELWHSKEQFQFWSYTSDFTHVSFYHKNTFKYIENKFAMTELYNDSKRIIILKLISNLD